MCELWPFELFLAKIEGKVFLSPLSGWELWRTPDLMWSGLCWSHLPKVYRDVCPSWSSSTLLANLAKEPQDQGFEGPVFPEFTSPWPTRASQVALVVKNLPATAGDIRDAGFDPRVGKIPWRRACQLIPVFLPRESQGQRSLGYGV